MEKIWMCVWGGLPLLVPPLSKKEPFFSPPVGAVGAVGALPPLGLPQKVTVETHCWKFRHNSTMCTPYLRL